MAQTSVIQLRIGTATDWDTAKPILELGELALDTTNKNFRVGDGLSNWSALTNWIASGSGGSGTVTSIGLTVPTGLSVTPSSITTSGTFAITFASGYSIPTTTSQTNWDAAYAWGNHSSAGYALLTASQTFIGLQTLTPASTSTGALRVNALTGQTGDLATFFPASGPKSVWVNSVGELNTGYYYTRFGGGGATAGLVTINPTNNIVPLTIKGAAAQGSNLQEWQNSAGTPLAKIDASGNFSATNYIPTYIQDTAPTSTPAKYMWWETTGGDLSLWIEDGT
jgi:hypothetical protein